MASRFSSLMFRVIPTVVLVGCGGGGERPDGPPTYPVKVQVLNDGSPLAGATVTLRKMHDGNYFMSGGTTGDDGWATIETTYGASGTVEGVHDVTVAKTSVTRTGGQEIPEGADFADYYGKDLGGTVDVNVEVDEKYSRFESSELIVNVSAEGNSEAVVEVTPPKPKKKRR